MKRLKSRIDALEQQTSGGGGVSMPAKKMLVEILARRDALFWPWRVTRNVQPPICELRIRQREYLSGTTGIAAKGSGNQSDWKTAHELRRQLIAAGMLTSTSSGGQITSLFLTRTGEAIASRLVGDRLADGRQSMLAFLLLETLTDDRGTPIRESVLLGVPSHGNPEDWADELEVMLPLLTSGCVRSTPDTVGRVLFSFTKGDRPPEPVAVAVDVAAEPWADDVYIAAFNSERHMLENVDPRDPSECFIPIGASDCWPKTERTIDEK